MSQFNAPIDTTIAARYYLQGAQLGTQQAESFNQTQRQALLDAQNQDFRQKQLAQDQLQYAGTQEFRGQELDFRNRRLEQQQAKLAAELQIKAAKTQQGQDLLRSAFETSRGAAMRATIPTAPQFPAATGAQPQPPSQDGALPGSAPAGPSPFFQGSQPAQVAPGASASTAQFLTPPDALLHPDSADDLDREALIRQYNPDVPGSLEAIKGVILDNQKMRALKDDAKYLMQQGLENGVDEKSDPDLAVQFRAIQASSDPAYVLELSKGLHDRFDEAEKRMALAQRVQAIMPELSPGAAQRKVRNGEALSIVKAHDEAQAAKQKMLAEQNTPEERDAKAQALMRKYPRKFPDMQSAIDEIMLAGNKKDYQYIDKLPSGDTSDKMSPDEIRANTAIAKEDLDAAKEEYKAAYSDLVPPDADQIRKAKGPQPAKESAEYVGWKDDYEQVQAWEKVKAARDQFKAVNQGVIDQSKARRGGTLQANPTATPDPEQISSLTQKWEQAKAKFTQKNGRPPTEADRNAVRAMVN